MKGQLLNRAIEIGIVLVALAHSGYAQILPDTEIGNVVVRKLDLLEIPLTDTYVHRA
jgi:hypothetical protein